jgi:hypothetical protein
MALGQIDRDRKRREREREREGERGMSQSMMRIEVDGSRVLSSLTDNPSSAVSLVSIVAPLYVHHQPV